MSKIKYMVKYEPYLNHLLSKPNIINWEAKECKNWLFEIICHEGVWCLVTLTQFSQFQYKIPPPSPNLHLFFPKNREGVTKLFFYTLFLWRKVFKAGPAWGGGDLKLKIPLSPLENVTCFYRLCNKPAL